MAWSHHSAPKGRTIPHLPEDLPVGVTAEQRDAARRTVAQHAENAEDAAQLLMALGLFPGQESEDFRIPDAFRFDWC
jgi:hypothetical protein